MSGSGEVTGDQLRAFVERIEHVDEEIKALTEDKRDLYRGKGSGLRCQDPARGHPDPKEGPEGPDEEESLLDVHLQPAMRTADPACVRSTSYSGAPTSGSVR